MKVEIENIEEKSSFVPYKVTFTILTPEDSHKFYDRIARRITGRAHQLISEAYQRSKNGLFCESYTAELD